MDVVGKRYRCRGCGQLLTFDEEGYVPREQLAACLGRCNWTFVGDDDAAGGGGQSPSGQR